MAMPPRQSFYLVTSLLSLMLLLSSCQGKSTVSKIPPLPQDNSIQVYFNYNRSKGAEYTEPYRLITRQGDNLEDVIVDAINSAQNTIDIAIQDINLPQVGRALVQQYQAGKQVRVIIENNYNLPLSKLSQDSGLAILKQANIPLIDDTEDGSKGSGLMHHKFIIIDNRKVITGSANFTHSGIHGDLDDLDTRGNSNHLLVIKDTKLAQIFQEEFNYMWGDGVGNKKDSLFGLQKPFRSALRLNIGNNRVTVKFSPTSRQQPWQETSNGLIVETLNKATKSVDLALFVFTKQPISDTLQQRYWQGVKIKALIDPNFAYRYYSEGLDLLGVELSNNCKYNPNNNLWRPAIDTVGIPNLPKGDKLHHKFAVIDTNMVITGSHNWSYSANYVNDEALLVIENPMIAEHFQREFNRLYEDAILGIPDWLQRRIDQDQQRCR